MKIYWLLCETLGHSQVVREQEEEEASSGQLHDFTGTVLPTMFINFASRICVSPEVVGVSRELRKSMSCDRDVIPTPCYIYSMIPSAM